MKQLDIVLQIETWIPVKLTIVVNASFVHLHLIWGVCLCLRESCDGKDVCDGTGLDRPGHSLVGKLPACSRNEFSS